MWMSKFPKNDQALQFKLSATGFPSSFSRSFILPKLGTEGQIIMIHILLMGLFREQRDSDCLHVSLVHVINP